jgi:uncharacterized zinc-type alcohol dehydrogenase-like protein
MNTDISVPSASTRAIRLPPRWKPSRDGNNPAGQIVSQETESKESIMIRAYAAHEPGGSLDFILSTVNVDLDWNAYLAALGPRGRLHSVGAVPSPLPIPAFTLLAGQKSVSGSPLGSPATTATMLEFCARHGIEAQTEHFPLSGVNDAMDHLRAGKARYRIVLDNDF